MKKKCISILSAVLLMMIFNSCASLFSPKATEEQKRMEKILSFEQKNKEELYIQTNAWFVKIFRSAESVIEFQDKEAGKIMGKYVFSLYDGIYKFNIKQVLSIDIKDEKIRIILSNPAKKLISNDVNYDYVTVKSQKLMEKIRLEWEKLIQSLITSIDNETNW